MPKMTGTYHVLPFDKLSPQEFERLCLWLVSREGYEKVEHRGLSGSDRGQDISAAKDNISFIFQCKRVRQFGPSDAIRELNKIAATLSKHKQDTVVFIVTAAVSYRTRQEAQSFWEDNGECHFWALTELDERVKRHPEILREFFDIGGGEWSHLHQLPPCLPDFVGREEEIETVKRTVRVSRKSCIALVGMPGVGKTALSIALASRFISEYPDAQFFLKLGGNNDAAQRSVVYAMASVLRAFGQRVPNDPVDLQAAYRSALYGKRVLMLLDDASGAEQVDSLMPGPDSLTLITTRRRFALPGINLVEVRPLCDLASRDLVLGIASRIGDHAATLSTLCGNLPLALRIAAGTILERKDLSVDTYIQDLRDRAEKLEAVDAAINLSYKYLDVKLRRAFRMLGCFPDSFTEMAASAVLSQKRRQSREDLGKLVQLSLLDWTESNSKYDYHVLIRDFALSRLDKKEFETARTMHAEYFLGFLNVIDDVFIQGGEAGLYAASAVSAESLNIRYAAEWSHTERARNERAKILSMLLPNAGSRVLNLFLSLREEAKWLDIGKEEAEAANVGELVALYLSARGVIAQNLEGAEQAIELQTEALNLATDLGNEELQQTAANNLGHLYNRIGHYSKALNFHEKILSYATKIGDKRRVCVSLGNLAETHKGLGDAKSALAFYVQSLKIAQAQGFLKEEAHAIGNIGVVYLSLGDLEKSEIHFLRHLELSRILGDQVGEGNALGNLGLLYAQQGKHREAINLYQAHLKLSGEIGDLYGWAGSLYNIALSLGMIGESEQAIKAIRTVLPVLKELQHPHFNEAQRILLRIEGNA